MSSIPMSFVGMFVLLLIAFALSKNRRAINWRTVIGAFAIQFLLGALVLYSETGSAALKWVSDGVEAVINYGNQGIEFLFAGLVSTQMFTLFPKGGGFVFALHVLPMIVFFSALIAVLYYIGIMQWVIRLLGGALHLILGTSRAESMSAAANVFVGQTEAPLVVKPFVKDMTESELFAIMCGGLASIAGSVLGGYAQMGVPVPYLIAASFMSAPGGLLFAKLLLPETENPPSNEHIINTFTSEDEDAPTNIIDAAANGASTGMHIALEVGAMLLAFVALIALINGILGGVGHWASQYAHTPGLSWLSSIDNLTLDKIFGWVFAPVAWLMGVPWGNEAHAVGALLGQKIAINEFYAYDQFKPFLQHTAAFAMSPKTIAIVSFALCGFANFSSIAILVGGLSIMAPNRRGDVARLGIYALIAGTLSNFMSATIAGLFIGLSGGNGLANITVGS